MLELELQPELFRPGNRVLILSDLAGLMLWPADPVRCEQLADSTATDWIMTLSTFRGEEIKAHDPSVSQLARSIPRAIDVLREAPSPECGRLAGLILSNVFSGMKMGEAMDEVIKIYGKPGNRRFGSQSKVAKVWSEYRAVAHFWLAHLILCGDREHWPVPCDDADIERFLALSEAARVAGENWQLWRSPNKVLDPKATWRVRAGIPLPVPVVPWAATPPSENEGVPG